MTDEQKQKMADKYERDFDDSHFENTAPNELVKEIFLAGLNARDEEIAKLEGALRKIVEYIDPDRPRGWHVYPTQFRDEAVNILKNMKTYDQCAEETILALEHTSKKEET